MDTLDFFQDAEHRVFPPILHDVFGTLPDDSNFCIYSEHQEKNYDS